MSSFNYDFRCVIGWKNALSTLVDFDIRILLSTLAQEVDEHIVSRDVVVGIMKTLMNHKDLPLEFADKVDSIDPNMYGLNDYTWLSLRGFTCGVASKLYTYMDGYRINKLRKVISIPEIFITSVMPMLGMQYKVYDDTEPASVKETVAEAPTESNSALEENVQSEKDLSNLARTWSNFVRDYLNVLIAQYVIASNTLAMCEEEPERCRRGVTIGSMSYNNIYDIQVYYITRLIPVLALSAVPALISVVVASRLSIKPENIIKVFADEYSDVLCLPNNTPVYESIVLLYGRRDALKKPMPIMSIILDIVKNYKIPKLAYGASATLKLACLASLNEIRRLHREFMKRQ
jgi:hypothetical protein